MITLKNYLLERIKQLKQRKMMIPKYLDSPGRFLGKKDFSMDDISKIDKDINECKKAP